MPRRHQLLAVAVTAVWGVNFVVIHWGLDEFPPLLFAALRFACIVFPAILLVPRPKDVGLPLLAGVGLFLSAGQFGFLFSAMAAGMPAGLASVVLQLQALFTIVFAVALLQERLTRRQVLGVAVALGGMGVIAAGRNTEVSLGALALCVAAAASWGLGNVCTRQARAGDPIALLVWSSVVAVPVLAVLSLVIDGPAQIGDALGSFDAKGLGALAYIVFASTFFGFGAWTFLMRHHPASEVAPFTLLVPPWGIAAAWIALGEVPNAAEATGALIAVAGLALLSFRTIPPWTRGSTRTSAGSRSGSRTSVRASER